MEGLLFPKPEKKQKAAKVLKRTPLRQKGKTVKAKKPVKKKKSLSKLKAKADSVFSEYIRRRDGGKCITCGCVKPWKIQQNGHFITRACLSLRFNEVNCNCQCLRCNKYKYGNIIEYRIQLVEKYGETIVNGLENLRHSTRKLTIEWYETFISTYTEKLKHMEDEP